MKPFHVVAHGQIPLALEPSETVIIVIRCKLIVVMMLNQLGLKI